jgi:hypothetical protein
MLLKIGMSIVINCTDVPTHVIQEGLILYLFLLFNCRYQLGCYFIIGVN